MSFSKLATALVRRWYVSLMGVLVTAALGLLAAQVVPVQYVAQAELLLLPPAAAVGNGGNPYLDLGGLGAATDVLSRAMTDPLAEESLRERGATGTWEVTPDGTSPAPLVLVKVTTEDSQAALDSLQLVIATAPEALKQLQLSSDVPDKALIRMETLTVSSRSDVVRKPKIRAFIVAVVVGIVGTLSLVALGDHLLSRRQEGGPKRHSGSAPLPVDDEASRDHLPTARDDGVNLPTSARQPTGTPDRAQQPTPASRR